jgi:transposase-like protein
MTNYADLTNPIFNNDEAARVHFESLRWEGGVPVCFHCGVSDDAVLVKRDETKAAAQKAKGKKTARDGLYYCRSCGKNFTATMGTVYEDSHIPMRKWLLATHLMAASKMGIPALQLQRMLGLGSYRTAWFMAMRIREAMESNGAGPMGGEGSIVEADETYYGKKEGPAPTKSTSGRPFTKGGRSGPSHKNAVVALVERGGKVRAFHVGNVTKEVVAKVITENVATTARLHTDESRLYTGADAHTATHETINHSRKEYAREDVNTNSVEGFFGGFKRSMSTYTHCREKYLGRYVRESEFRYNTRTKLGFNDRDRAAAAVKGAVGKRLTLRPAPGR